MTKKKVSVWMIIWKHPNTGDWFPWEFVPARRKRSELFPDLRSCRSRYSRDTFKLQKFTAEPA